MQRQRAERRPRTYLNIDFEKKDFAKLHGARWDAGRKNWYILGDIPEALSEYAIVGSQVKNPDRLDVTSTNSKTCFLQKSTTSSNVGENNSGDFFIPSLYELSAKDSQSIMDVAVFRLSKKEKRAGEVITYKLPDGHVHVSAGSFGMASVWDYDIVLMAISHLTEAMNRHRSGKGERPGRIFRPYVSELLKFCRRSDGGRQKDDLVDALVRLNTTHVAVERTRKSRSGGSVTVSEGEPLISRYKVISNSKNGKPESVEIELPNWLFREVVESDNPDVLTMHQDFFLIEPGIGKFLYRLARRAAGKNKAKWAFKTIYERSGSAGSLKKFTENLRKIISDNDLPEYHLTEDQGQDGPLLVMTYRSGSTTSATDSSFSP
jgi:plasmid replication initiation protein